MRTRSRFLSGARGALIPAALSGLLALAGCAGGGGGPGIPDNTPPVPFTYPASLTDATSTDNVDGFISPYALDTAGKTISPVTTTVFGTSPSAGKITITVGDIVLPSPSGLTEPTFAVTFNPDKTSNLSTLLGNSPLGSLPFQPCADCLRTAQAPAVINGSPTSTMVTFTYLDPTSLTFPLTYSALGIWTKPTTTGTSGGLDLSWPEIGGAFSAGVLTRGVDLPTTGTASYDGYFIGRYATSVDNLTPGVLGGNYLVGANAHADADFSITGAGGVTFSTSNSQISGGALATPVAESRLDLTTLTPMTITRTSTGNSFEGVVVSKDVTGFFQSAPANPNVSGAFYGPPATTGVTPGDFAPRELGGALGVSNSTGQGMVGSFALKKNP